MSQRQIGYRYLIVISFVTWQSACSFFRPLMIAHHNGESCYHTTSISRLTIYSGTKQVVRLCLIPLSCLQFDHRSADFNITPGTGNDSFGLCPATPCFIHFVTHVLQPCLQIDREIVFREFVLERITKDRHGHIITCHNDKPRSASIVENIVRRLQSRRTRRYAFTIERQLQRRCSPTCYGCRLPKRESQLPRLIFCYIFSRSYSP